MAEAQNKTEWFPQTPAVNATDVDSRAVLVLHYWARWDLHDRIMDERLAALQADYGTRMCFRSCDVDYPENQRFIRGIENIPALGCFIRGQWLESVVGLRSESELRALLDRWLAASNSPAN